MSTYYFLVCHTHRVYCDGASRSAGGVGHLVDSIRLLPGFIVLHHGCSLASLNEYEVERLEEQRGYREITVDDLRKIIPDYPPLHT